MNNSGIFPGYTPRKVEQQYIEEMILKVRQDQKTRVVLLYGPGGTGKSYLVRNLPDMVKSKNLIWFGPFDIDDSQYWILPNLELEIARTAQGKIFDVYFEYMSRVSGYEKQHIGHETVLAYLRKGSEVFLECYSRLLKKTNKTPVLIFDTVESARGMDIADKLIRWIEKVPGTLIILAGRPVESPNVDPFMDGFPEESPIVLEKKNISEFTLDESRKYFDNTLVAKELTDEEKSKIILLTKGHPLWLALSVYYLSKEGLPQVVTQYKFADLSHVKEHQTVEFEKLHEKFIRQLLVPYQKRVFWNEAILRLGVLRRMVSKEIWKKIVSDRGVPSGASSWNEAWNQLLEFPWVRTRANNRYVTLHDALAEELARRIIPAEDKDKKWRYELWRNAVNIYSDLIESQKVILEQEEEQLDQKLKKSTTNEANFALTDYVLSVDAHRLEIELLQTTALYYQILTDNASGCNLFNDTFERTLSRHEYRFADLLWAEMQRFLPGQTTYDPLEDIVRSEVVHFQDWYKNHPEMQYELVRRVSRYLIDKDETQTAEEMLTNVWNVCQGDLEHEYVILNLRGNARLRIPGKSEDAGRDFEDALACIMNPSAPESLRVLAGQAHSELGYYYRNTGDWEAAANSYLDALRITPLDQPIKRAAIQSQYAYVQALKGLYQAAHDLVDASLKVRRKHGLKFEEGMALSVKGEIHRYERHYPEAWQAYLQARNIFDELEHWGWQGLVQQEMAICLYQAYKVEVELPGYEKDHDGMLEDAQALILEAVEFCKDYSLRNYPSALNRAGRIIGIGYQEYDQGLAYLEEGAKVAREVADGWFLFANLVQHVELSYQAWLASGEKELHYLKNIDAKEKEIETAYSEYNFPDLKGRWELLKGQKAFKQAQAIADLNQQNSLYEIALEHFKKAYPLISRGYVGSHGIVALPEEFDKLVPLMKSLPETQRKEWLEALGVAWSVMDKERQATSLLSFLTNLYVDVSL